MNKEKFMENHSSRMDELNEAIDRMNKSVYEEIDPIDNISPIDKTDTTKEQFDKNSEELDSLLDSLFNDL